MDKKLQIIIIAVILALFLSLMALAVYQQKKINDLKRIIFPETGAGQAGSLGSKGQNQNVIPLAVAEQKKKELINNTREIEGTVASVSRKEIKVNAEIVDLDKIKIATSEDVSTFAKIKKDFTVATNDGTQFLSRKLSDIKKGDSIKVHTSDSVYAQNSLTATIVISPVVSAEEAANSGPKFVSGRAEKIENGVLTIQAIDEKGKFAGKIYTVKTGSNTKVFKQEMPVSSPDQASQASDKTSIKISDIKAGDSIIALSSEAIKDRTSFEAVEIILLVALPKE